MLAFFEKEYPLRSNDFDSSDKILPSAVLDLFQSTAGEHASHLNVGYGDLIKKNLIWVLTKVKFEIIKQPEKQSTIKVKTWPLKNGRVTFEREYLIFNQNGEVLIKGSSEWVTVDTEKRKIASPGNIYSLDENEFIKEKNFDEKFFKVPSFAEEENRVCIRPRYTDFDINGHVNNTKYADFILNSVPYNKSEKIIKMQIDYHLEIKEKEEIFIYYKEYEDKILISGKNKDGQIHFSSYIQKNGCV